MPTVLPFCGVYPKIAASAFLAPGAVIIGDVEVDENASIWPLCVLRGDVGPIRIGVGSNIQDGTLIHVTEGGQGTHIGADVTVGHGAVLHDCTLDDGAFVGIRATILDGARVEGSGMLAAGALLTPGKVVCAGQIWAGSPARFWRDVSEAQSAEFAARAHEYVALTRAYRK